MLLEQGLALCRALHPHEVKTFDELHPSYRSRPLEGDNFDSGTEVDGSSTSRLLFKGKRPTLAMWGEVQKAVSRMLRKQQHPSFRGWTRDMVMNSSAVELGAYIHTSASLRGEETVHSTRHKGARTRRSNYVRLDYRGDVTYSAVVRYFVRLTHPAYWEVSDGLHPVLRVALCDLYKIAPAFMDDDIGVMETAVEGEFHRVGYAVPVDDIAYKVICANETAAWSRPSSRDDLYFMTYTTQSGS